MVTETFSGRDMPIGGRRLLLVLKLFLSINRRTPFRSIVLGWAVHIRPSVLRSSADIKFYK